MGVYIIAQLRFKDIEKYRAYQKAFPAVFDEFSGAALVADEAPEIVEGEWPFNKVVVLFFSTEEEAIRFQSSREYNEIAKNRKAGADATVIVAKGAEIHPI